MNLAEIREKVTMFLLPVSIVGVVLGLLIFFIGQAYFWDVSRLTVRVSGDKPVQVRLDIQARFVYFDADLFGFYYPVHITIPFSKTQTCHTECVFDRIPAGDGTVTVLGEKTIRAQVFIEPDTRGTLNLRPVFEVKKILDGDIINRFRAPEISQDEKKDLNIEKMHALLGLAIVRRNRDILLYDTKTKQLLSLPMTTVPLQMARGEKDGVYIFWTKEGTLVWDRYGREPMTKIVEMNENGVLIQWSTDNTILTYRGHTEKLQGIWMTLPMVGKMYISNGQAIMEIVLSEESV